MAECKIPNGGDVQGMCSVKLTLVIFTVLCCIAGAVYITGAGKQIKEVLEHVIKADLHRRR